MEWEKGYQWNKKQFTRKKILSYGSVSVDMDLSKWLFLIVFSNANNQKQFV